MACIGVLSSIFVVFLAKVILMVLQMKMLPVVAEEATSSTLRKSENERHVHSSLQHNVEPLKIDFDEDFVRDALRIPVPFTDGSCFMELYAGFVGRYIESNSREDILKLINQKVAMPISKILYRSMRNVIPQLVSSSVPDDDFNDFENLVAQKCNVGDRIRRNMVNVNGLVQDFASSNRGPLSDRMKDFASSNRGQLSNLVKDIGSNRGQLSDRVKGFASSSRGQLSNLIHNVGNNNGQPGNTLRQFEVGEVSGQSPAPKLLSGTLVRAETVKFLEQILSGKISPGGNLLPVRNNLGRDSSEGERGKLVQKVLPDMNFQGGSLFHGINIPAGSLLLGRNNTVVSLLPAGNFLGNPVSGNSQKMRNCLVAKINPECFYREYIELSGGSWESEIDRLRATYIWKSILKPHDVGTVGGNMMCVDNEIPRFVFQDATEKQISLFFVEVNKKCGGDAQKDNFPKSKEGIFGVVLKQLSSLL